MRKRRIRSHNIPGQNLDSFLDILTNTVGTLMFIGLFVSLLTVQAGSIIRTPLKTNTKKIGHFFEIKNNQLFYINDPQVDEQINKLFAELPKCYKPNVPENLDPYLYNYYLQEITKYNQCMNIRYEKIQSFNINTGYYQVSFANADSLKYEPIPNVNGENKEELRADNSKFKTILNNLDSSNNYVAFLVRPDSFPTFRAAREQAWKNGFDVGWEPIPQTSPLVFGSGGRSIGVQ